MLQLAFILQVMTGKALRYTVWLGHEQQSCARSPLGFALVYTEAKRSAQALLGFAFLSPATELFSHLVSNTKLVKHCIVLLCGGELRRE